MAGGTVRKHGKRRRFGISLPEKLANQLDSLSSRLGIDRSSLIEIALKEYLHEMIEQFSRHECTGLFIIVSSYGRRYSVEEVMESFRDIISSYNHVHANGRCIETFVVSGSSDKVLELYSVLSSMGCRVRYIPISS